MNKSCHRVFLAAVLATTGAAVVGPVCSAYAGDTAASDANRTSVNKQAHTLLSKALKYLQSQQQPDGSWQIGQEPPGMTAIVLRGLVQSDDYTSKTPFVAKGFDKLFTYQTESGGIFKDALANYNTSIAVSAMAAAHDPAFQERIDKAVKFLHTLQWDDKSPETPDHIKASTPADPRWGGVGYGHHKRPDLSNTQFTLEALHDAGLKQDDPAFKEAQVFLSRCQNRSESNDQKYSGDDGGFIYGPASGEGDSEAGSEVGPDGRKIWRSYGSMTYAGLKSMLYAGLTKQDPRVQAAFSWIKNNYTVDGNPGMELADSSHAQNGLYYYYQVMAGALHAYGQPIITDSHGKKHDWRVDMVAKLATLEKSDGSWVGEKRFMENNPRLTTAYVALTLENILKDLKDHPTQ